MAKKTYIGVSSKARKVKKAYIGVSGTARKIKKIYMGVNGIARQIFGGGEITYYGKATNSNNFTTQAVTIGNYALFAGGTVNYNMTNLVTTYNASLTKGSATSLSVSRKDVAAAAVGNYALICGGCNNNDNILNTVDTYNKSLVKGSSTLTYGKAGSRGATLGNYALIVGGNSAYTLYYDSSLTQGVTSTKLDYSRAEPALVSFDNKVLIGNGNQYIEYYNSSLTHFGYIALSKTREDCSAARTNNYAIYFGGATRISSDKKSVDAFNKSLTRISAPNSTNFVQHASGISLGDFAVFARGRGGNTYNATSFLNNVEIYDDSLTKQIDLTLSDGNYNSSSTVLGNYGLIVDAGQNVDVLLTN